MREVLEAYLKPVFEILNYNIFALGEAKITPLSIIYFLLLSLFLIFITKKLQRILISKLLGKTRLDSGAQESVGTISRYLMLLLGFLVIFQTLGINLTTLNVLAGAVGIGIGFGLQNVANNFISGLIILFERPIKIGDRIEVGDVSGQVSTIGARSTRVRTNDNITIIVPNSKFISDNVINWSFENSNVRFKIPVEVAYDSDIELVTDILIKIAEADDNIEQIPPPSVRLMSFEESALKFELRVWSKKLLQRPGLLKSNLNFAILKEFREHNIDIPFPQRDITIKSSAADNSN